MNKTILSDVRLKADDLYDFDEQRESYQPFEAWLTKKKSASTDVIDKNSSENNLTESKNFKRNIVFSSVRG